MFLIKKDLQVSQVIYGKGNVELIKVGIQSENKAMKNFAVIYVPPKTRSWSGSEHKEMQNKSLSEMEELIRYCGNLTVMGDFNCKEVNWEELTTERSEDSWGNKMLKFAMENTLTSSVRGRVYCVLAPLVTYPRTRLLRPG